MRLESKLLANLRGLLNKEYISDRAGIWSVGFCGQRETKYTREKPLEQRQEIEATKKKLNPICKRNPIIS